MDIETNALKLWEIKQQIKALAKLEAELSDILKKAADGKTSMFGNFMYVLKMRKGAIKYTDIPALLSVDLELYRGADIHYYELTKL